MVIKFRAWDKELKRLWWNVQDAYDTLGHHHTPDPKADREGNDFEPDSFGDVLTGYDKDRYVVMMFSGLTDKNGTEIYEGDIIKDINAGYNVLREVRFGREHVGWAEEGADIIGFYMPQKGGYFDALYRGDNLEVVGNIYANPEMLKQEAP